jgi:hypothetical protein
VKHVLSYDPKDITVPHVPDYCFKSDPKLAAQLYMMRANLALHDKYTTEKMLETQRNFRHQLNTQSRVTYEIEVDDDGETAVGSSGQTRKLN